MNYKIKTLKGKISESKGFNIGFQIKPVRAIFFLFWKWYFVVSLLNKNTLPKMREVSPNEFSVIDNLFNRPKSDFLVNALSEADLEKVKHSDEIIGRIIKQDQEKKALLKNARKS